MKELRKTVDVTKQGARCREFKAVGRWFPVKLFYMLRYAFSWLCWKSIYPTQKILVDYPSGTLSFHTELSSFACRFATSPMISHFKDSWGLVTDETQQREEESDRLSAEFSAFSWDKREKE